MVLLAAGRAHTDESAERAISALGYDGRMIETLRRFGYLVRTGPEWRLESSLREAVLSHHAASERAADPLWVSAHQHYFSVARTGGSEDPLLFLRGMTYYRQGRVVEAVELLRRVSRADDQTAEVAIAQHLVARMDCERGGADEVAEARKMFKLSLANARSRGDKIHQSHAEHSLAICLLSQRRPDTERAVQLLESALALTRETGDEWGQAKVLHTLGQVLSRYPKSRGQALQYLQRSRDIGTQLGFTRHVGKVDESIARAKGVAAASGAAEGKLKSKSAPRRRARRQRRS
ncbi:tetratricopeptide repeat protein [Microbacterium aureliae]